MLNGRRTGLAWLENEDELCIGGVEMTVECAVPEPEPPAEMVNCAAEQAVQAPLLDAGRGPARVPVGEPDLEELEHSIATLQGYITASQRLLQLHSFRALPSGRLGEIAGPGEIRGDAFMRLLKFRPVAEQMAADLEANFPDHYAVLAEISC